ncbi:MAG: hypothetical protein AAFR61_13210 [Bacteroidota bacterium]
MKTGISFGLFFLAVLNLSFAQEPDFAMDRLYSFHVDRPSWRYAEPKVEASAELYSFGNTLSLVVEVKDTLIRLRRDPNYCDHIEVRFALPQHIFPEDYDFTRHPNMLVGQSRAEDGSGKTRFFSHTSEDAVLDPTTVQQQSDYPSANEIQRLGWDVPYPQNLSLEEVHFGMVHFAFFPDQRKVKWMNRDQMVQLEKVLGFRFGDLTEGIKYEADYREKRDGYIITIQFGAAALGFLPLPSLDKVRFQVDVFDTSRGGVAQRVCSTSATGEDNRPLSYTEVGLMRPLQTNVIQAPEEFMKAVGFTPVLIRADSQWVSVAIDVDYLIYAEQFPSRDFIEVVFSRQPFAYKKFKYDGYLVERMSVGEEFVNEVGKQHHYTRIDGKLIHATRARHIIPEPGVQFANPWFRFPDGQPGWISVSNTPNHPFGWGECGSCLEEGISIQRVNRNGVEDILFIQQSDGPQAYCQVGDQAFEDFFVSKLDWIQEGEVMVVWLTHRFLKKKERLKVSWDDDGSDLEVELLD